MLAVPEIEGEFYQDSTTRTLYATDASAYREVPLGVAIPKNEGDVKALLNYAIEHKVPLIPRAAGTSLAGQVVGKGLVVDVSKYLTEVLEISKEESWVRVQPGINRDELNLILEEHGMFFGPETSTSNRARIGGMVGNNSCGSNSVFYGSTRDHLLEARVLLADGSEVTFKELTKEEFEAKCRGEGVASELEQKIYQHIQKTLRDPERAGEIRREFPKSTIPRRNTGYALDMLLELAPFSATDNPFNFCQLVAGSEGTLCFLLEVKLHCNAPKPKQTALVCAHFNSVYESLQANLIALKYQPYACELMDDIVLEATKANAEQRKNRFFVQGDPAALLMVELNDEDPKQLELRAEALVDELKSAGFGYHYPIVWNEETKKVWTLRKAGLGVLANIPGDEKAVPVIEDTAVDVEDLPEYIREFGELMNGYGKRCVHYAHAGSGELHLRPILNLKTQEGKEEFRSILNDVALLVKKYRGSLSGEHGDGRLRGEFIKTMIGEKNYALVESIKRTWDPDNLFNPGKIVDTPPMNEQLRYEPGQSTREVDTVFDFEESLGIQRMAEKCNGSGDCRKSHLMGGTMCPSYMATKDEKHTTRARANILREYLTHSEQENPFAHEEIKEVMDLCLSCKGCKSECPSNVDVGKMKAEWMHHYYKAKGLPFRSWMVSRFSFLNRLAQPVYPLYNFMFGEHVLGRLAKRIVGFHPKRTLPRLHRQTFKTWFRKNKSRDFGVQRPERYKGKVYILADEFTNYNDISIGKAAVQLLTRLGYEVEIPDHLETGRSAFSKGLLDYGKGFANENVRRLHKIIDQDAPLVGLEPSALLCFRDEYPDLLRGEDKQDAQKLAENCYLLEEFLEREMDAGRLDSSLFTRQPKVMHYHGHCMQKALSSLTPVKRILELPENYQVRMIPSGCCGMAGSFGYEQEHYEVSMDIGELVLLPRARQIGEEALLVAPGTSCRHQVKDGTDKRAYHPAEVLLAALSEE